MDMLSVSIVILVGVRKHSCMYVGNCYDRFRTMDSDVMTKAVLGKLVVNFSFLSRVNRKESRCLLCVRLLLKGWVVIILSSIIKWQSPLSPTSCVRGKPVPYCRGFTLFIGLLRARGRTHACWLGAAGRRKNPNVPSDVIKAKNFLFSLCIHGEFVSNRSKCVFRRSACFVSEAFSVVSKCLKWHVTILLYNGL